MRLSASTWIPWLFFSPLLVAMVSGALYGWLRHPLLAVTAQIALALAGAVGLAAFIAARRAATGPNGRR